jgi:predicted nucleic acid-binding protein
MKIGIDTTFMIEASIGEHPGHAAARLEMERRLAAGTVFFLAPQVIAEFIHVITDPRRFEKPLAMPEALEKARGWWGAREVRHAYPTSDSLDQFHAWMRTFSRGRKRILDTMLAATYFSHQVNTILSSNARDYAVFGCFDVIIPHLSAARPSSRT